MYGMLARMNKQKQIYHDDLFYGNIAVWGNHCYKGESWEGVVFVTLIISIYLQIGIKRWIDCAETFVIVH